MKPIFENEQILRELRREPQTAFLVLEILKNSPTAMKIVTNFRRRTMTYTPIKGDGKTYWISFKENVSSNHFYRIGVGLLEAVMINRPI